MINIAIFASGSGTNCENIIRYFDKSKRVKIALVLSNKQDALVLDKANNLGVNTIYLPKKDFNNPKILLELMRQFNIDFIVLAGFLLIIPDFLIQEYEYRLINIHPSLLPKFGGIGMYGHYVHKAVKQAEESTTGMTVHYVSSQVDGGKIIAQFSTPILPTDTIEDIAAKEHILEMEHFPVVIEDVINQTFMEL